MVPKYDLYATSARRFFFFAACFSRTFAAVLFETIAGRGFAAVLVGFSKLPSKSNLYGFLDKISVARAEKFGIACAKAFKTQGIFNEKTVNLDGHLISYFGDLKIVKDKTSYEKCYHAGDQGIHYTG